MDGVPCRLCVVTRQIEIRDGAMSEKIPPRTAELYASRPNIAGVPDLAAIIRTLPPTWRSQS